MRDLLLWNEACMVAQIIATQPIATQPFRHEHFRH